LVIHIPTIFIGGRSLLAMSTESSLHGKTALITGASAGIGRETAHALAEHGSDIILAARRTDRLQTLAETIEANCDVETLVVGTDVSDEKAVDDLIEASIETFGTLDIVVNNAGTGTEREVGVEKLETEQYRTVMNVNTDGMFFTARAALPHLRKSSGILIFVGSFAGQYPRPASPVYAATKWWTRGFALSLAGEVGDEDVGVTIINPSEVRTEFGKEFRAEEQLAKNRYKSDEVTDPEVVAKAILFAAQQSSPNVVTELDLYRRDKFVGF
jgi:NADP-dependent 3-hydroxy acid dehydrogenase YdfG